MGERFMLVAVTREVLLPQRKDWVLAAVCSVGTWCITLLALTTLSIPLVNSRQAERLDSVTPQVSELGTRTDDTGLRMIPSVVTNGRRWDGHRIIRHYFSSSSGAGLTLPGIRSMPGPGEFYASPALGSLIASNTTVAALFQRLSPVGVISPAGLVQPHELRAVIGVDRATPLQVPVTGFGATAPTGSVEAQQDQTRLNRVVAGFVGAMVWLPAAAFIVMMSRLAATLRRRRARALRLVGVARATVRGLQAVEMGALALPGTVVALLTYGWLQPHLTKVPGTDVGFFAADARMPWWMVALGLAAPVLALGVSAALALDPEAPDDVTATAPRAWAPRIGRLSLVAGALMLALAPVMAQWVGFAAAASLWAGCALVAVGLALAGPSVTMTVMARVARRAGSGGRLVGARLASSSASTSLRLGSLLAVIIVMLVGGGAFVDVLNGGRSDDWHQRVRQQPYVPVIASDLIGDLTLDDVHRLLPSVAAAQQVQGRVGRRTLPIVLADCAGLSRLTGAPAENCTGKAQWLGNKPPGVSGAQAVELPDGSTRSVPDGANVASLRNAPSSFTGSLLLPENLAPAPSGDGSLFFLLPRSDNLMPDLARLSSAAPTLQWDLGQLDRHNPDTQEFPGQIEWLLVGARTSLLLGALALVVSSLGETRERTSRLRTLHVLGAPRRTQLGAHWWATAAPLSLLGLAGTALGWLTVVALHRFDDRASVDTLAILQVGCGVIAGATAVALITWANTRRPRA